MTRLETFIDAAFAFAISMLVIGAQQIPDISIAPGGVQECAGVRLQHLCAGNFLARPLVVEPALRSRRWRVDPDQLDDDCTILIFIYPLRQFLERCGFSQRWPGWPAARAAHDRSAGAGLCDLRARVYCHFAGILLLNLRAWQLREPLRLNARERLMTRGEVAGWSIPVASGSCHSFFLLPYR